MAKEGTHRGGHEFSFGGGPSAVAQLRGFMRDLYDVVPHVTAEAFHYAATLVPLHGGLLIDTRSTGLMLQRTLAHIARSCVDHYQVSLLDGGTCELEVASRGLTLRQGDIFVRDLEQPVTVRRQPTRNGLGSRVITLVLPRMQLAPLLARPSAAHGSHIAGSSAYGQIVAQQIRVLRRTGRVLAPGEHAAVIQAIGTLIASGLGRPQRRRDDPMARLGRQARLDAIKHYIDLHLGSSELNADLVCRHFGISRATLYRLLEPLGGLSHHIKARRLHQAYARVVSPSRTPQPLAWIAAESGFSSFSSFIRAFRRQFGLTPGEARELLAGREKDPGTPVRSCAQLRRMLQELMPGTTPPAVATL